MSELSVTKILHKSDQNSSVMESCYKLYMWLNHTLFMLLLIVVWKIRQISDYFSSKSAEDIEPSTIMEISPLTKETKRRRHIRSMSDVQSSTPYGIHMASRNHRKASYHSVMCYDSDTRNKRLRYHYRPRYLESSDSSDYQEVPIKLRTIEKNIMKPPDSMRFL